ncbi:hypothetical protein [Enterococcus sp. AZ163]|uniref:hypothetical protein n=1 Tax=Enterococcus sp. AZ163 TaxID=2774638 RepID=UPI003D2BD120
MAKKRLTDIEAATKRILEKKGIHNLEEWQKQKLNERKMLVLQGDDKEWEKSVLDQEMMKVVLDSLKQGGN